MEPRIFLGPVKKYGLSSVYYDKLFWLNCSPESYMYFDHLSLCPSFDEGYV
jgi:hypothetical protein